MENNTCRTCKYYHNGQCKNKDFKNSISSEIDYDIYDIFESGALSESLQESLDFKYIKDEFIKELQEQNFIKNFKNINKFNDDSFQITLVEEIENRISNFLIRSIKNININVSVNSDFSCKYWE